MTDTIFALATGPARAAIGMVRISGPLAGEALITLAGRLPEPRRASLRTLRDPVSRQILDEAVLLWFPAPASFTGEDQAELCLHGGPAVISGVITALSALNLRPAEPGEFTRRAFEHGRMDLVEAEAVADLIDAETSAQRDQAIAQLGGGLSRRHEAWRASLIQASAMLEVDIDFPDDDVPSGLEDKARSVLEGLVVELSAAISDKRGAEIRDGYRIALIGAPNAGKSSLLNAIAARDAAIVTEIAGTTRDIIEAHLVMSGFRTIIADTAGLRASVDRIELEGMRRAETWASEASLRVLVIDQSSDVMDWDIASNHMTSNDIVVLNKSDLKMSSVAQQAVCWAESREIEYVSCQANSANFAELRDILNRKVTQSLSGTEVYSVTRVRHRAILANTLECINRGLASGPSDRIVEDVRLASRALSQLVGEIGSEDVLDQIFGTFCIGK